MKNSEQPISPCIMQKVGDDSYRLSKGNDPKEWQVSVSGLTKREYFAGLAMQGYCGGEYTGQSGMPHDRIAKWSVKMADELLKELDKDES